MSSNDPTAAGRGGSLESALDHEIAALEAELRATSSPNGFIIASAKLDALRRIRFPDAPFYRTYE